MINILAFLRGRSAVKNLQHCWSTVVPLCSLSGQPLLKSNRNAALAAWNTTPTPNSVFPKPLLEQQRAAASLWENVTRERHQQYFSFFCIWAIFWVFPALLPVCHINISPVSHIAVSLVHGVDMSWGCSAPSHVDDPPVIILTKNEEFLHRCRTQTAFFTELLFWKHSTDIFVSFFPLKHFFQSIMPGYCAAWKTQVSWVALVGSILGIFLFSVHYWFWWCWSFSLLFQLILSSALWSESSLLFPACLPSCHQCCHVKAVGKCEQHRRRNCNWAMGWKQMIKNEKGSRYTKSPRIAETTAKKAEIKCFEGPCCELKTGVKKRRGGNISLRCFSFCTSHTLGYGFPSCSRHYQNGIWFIKVYFLLQHWYKGDF